MKGGAKGGHEKGRIHDFLAFFTQCDFARIL